MADRTCRFGCASLLTLFHYRNILLGSKLMSGATALSYACSQFPAWFLFWQHLHRHMLLGRSCWLCQHDSCRLSNPNQHLPVRPHHMRGWLVCLLHERPWL